MRRKQFGAIGEIVTIFLGLNLLARSLSGVLGLSSIKAALEGVPEGTQPEFLRLAWVTALDLGVKYGLMMGAAFALGWYYRRRPLTAYGLSRNDRSWPDLLGSGILLYAVVGTPVLLLLMADRFIGLGQGAAHWWIFDTHWNVGFWVFMFVSSFGLVPVFEELFTRGYVQMRLSEESTPATAIVITACLFSFAHTQYCHLSVMSLGMLATIIFSSLVGGYVFYRTGSLVPVIVSHAIGNLPLRPGGEYILLGLCLVLLVMHRQRILAGAREFTGIFAQLDGPFIVIGLGVVGVMVLGLLMNPSLLLIAAAVGLLLMLGLQRRQKVSG